MNQFVIILLALLSNQDEYKCGITIYLQRNYFSQGCPTKCLQIEHKKSPYVNNNCKIIYQSHQAGECE